MAVVKITSIASAGVLFCRGAQSLVTRARMVEENDNSEAALDECMALALGCIMQSCAWVEGFANDVCERSGRDRDATWLPAVTNRDLLGFIHRVWDLDLNARGRNGLDRWLGLFDQLELKFDRRTEAVKSMRLLVDLRNQFTHAEPMIHPFPTDPNNPDYEHPHSILKRGLDGKFRLARDGRGMFFPFRVLSVGCAEWSFRTAHAFCIQVSGALGIPDPYAQWVTI